MPSADRSSKHFMKLSGVHSCSLGVRVSAVIATRAKRSAFRCFGSARANCALTLSSDSKPFSVRGFDGLVISFSGCMILVSWDNDEKCDK